MKKTIATILSIAMMLSLSACDSDSNAETAQNDTTVAEKTTTTTITEEIKPFDFGDINYSVSIPMYDVVKETEETEYESGIGFNIEKIYSNHKFDSYGRIISKKDEYSFENTVQGMTNDRSEQMGVYTYEYNEKGQLLSEQYKGIPQTLRNKKMEYTYNEDNLIDERVTTVFSEGNEVYEMYLDKYVYVFDDNNRIESRGRVETTGLYTEVTQTEEMSIYEYDDNDRIVSESVIVYENGIENEATSAYKLENEYDSFGNIIRVTETRKASTGIILYEYDLVGNAECSTENNENMNTTDNWVSFEECIDLPTPDSCLSTIKYDSVSENDGVKIYTYLLDGDKKTANTNYQIYQAILSDVCGFKTEVKDNAFYVYSNDKIIAVMMAGYDNVSGSFMQISFGGEKALKETVSEKPATEKNVSEETISDPDIRTLKWGMSLDEVKKYEVEKDYLQTIENTDVAEQILLVYQNVEFEGYNTEMTLSIGNDGLDGVNYRIIGVGINEVYNKIVSQYGEPSNETDWGIFWDINSDESIFLTEYSYGDDIVTQWSFFG
ncbi:MAG: hypothetical protein IJ035_06315 [Oscillospiraceae bacterium]|nr:hypothetical protein [Oscillospiraceae bacterium]